MSRIVEAGVLLVHHPRTPAWACGRSKVLREASPATLPVEQPVKFDFVLNLKTAKALGLTVPPAVLTRADEVID